MQATDTDGLESEVRRATGFDLLELSNSEIRNRRCHHAS